MKDKIAFVGRSNVGKSSVIRLLTGKRVRIGRRPGTTLEPRFIPYGRYTIVDMPGFGFMSGVSERRQEEVKDLIVHYLEGSEDIAFAVEIVDAHAFLEIAGRWDKRGMIPVEVEMYQFLEEVGLSPLVVCNKMDKVARDSWSKRLRAIARWLGAKKNVSSVLIPFSAKKGFGLDELKMMMRAKMAE
ncbi:MAG: GTP-binding protein EngB [Candidatus Hydrothermarchaeaceae archaeon]